MSESECLPYDVVYDILTLLPVKLLMRLRCVSKSFNSIITNPVFINSHLDRGKKPLSNNNHGYLQYMPVTADRAFKELSTLVYNTDRTFTQISRFQIPFSNGLVPKVDRIAGFCNGIFLLLSYDDTVLYLWNPSIRKSKKLLPSTIGRNQLFTLGFAYHSQNNDFKILRIVCHKGCWPMAEVYTLSTDSWREVVVPVDYLFRSFSQSNLSRSFSFFFNGALHKVVDCVKPGFILSFDVNDETFCKMMLPQHYLDEFEEPFEQLAEFKGLLALFVFNNDVYDFDRISHIWVMREYGVFESWTKICVSMGFVDKYYGCTDSGELLIENNIGLISFHSESLSENNLGISLSEDAKEYSQWVGYTANSTESLVLLDRLDVSSKYED
uniref:F-box domain-containing protein n=1 Tax=Fagus sylvatica TaxID=28930 RepID=A0A2N9IQT9_FAGSY